MARYDTLDRLILEAIKDGSRDFTKIAYGRAVQDESDVQASLQGGSDSFRIVDRRLQALRRAGKIGFVPTGKKWPGGGGWFLVANKAGE